MQKVLLRDMQRHPFKQLCCIWISSASARTQAIRVRVPLHFLNQDMSPAGKTSGVVIMHELTDVEISCLPKDLPEFIGIDLSGLSVGDIVHLSELVLPAGVEIPELRLGREHDHAVVVAKEVREEVEPTSEEGDEAAIAAAAATVASGAPAAAATPAAAPAAPAKKDEKK